MRKGSADLTLTSWSLQERRSNSTHTAAFIAVVVGLLVVHFFVASFAGMPGDYPGFGAGIGASRSERNRGLPRSNAAA